MVLQLINKVTSETIQTKRSIDIVHARSFEHRVKLGPSGYPEPSAMIIPTLFSRSVSIADDYDIFKSGRFYQRRRLRANDARDQMFRGRGTIYDPSLMKAFAGLFK